jgi:hypothetical protein
VFVTARGARHSRGRAASKADPDFDPDEPGPGPLRVMCAHHRRRLGFVGPARGVQRFECADCDRTYELSEQEMFLGQGTGYLLVG